MQSVYSEYNNKAIVRRDCQNSPNLSEWACDVLRSRHPASRTNATLVHGTTQRSHHVLSLPCILAATQLCRRYCAYCKRYILYISTLFDTRACVDTTDRLLKAFFTDLRSEEDIAAGKENVTLSARQWAEVQSRLGNLNIPSTYLNRIPSFVSKLSGKKKKAPLTHTIEAALNFAAYLSPFAFEGFLRKLPEQTVHLFSQIILLLLNFTLDPPQVRS